MTCKDMSEARTRDHPNCRYTSAAEIVANEIKSPVDTCTDRYTCMATPGPFCPNNCAAHLSERVACASRALGALLFQLRFRTFWGQTCCKRFTVFLAPSLPVHPLPPSPPTPSLRRACTPPPALPASPPSPPRRHDRPGCRQQVQDGTLLRDGVRRLALATEPLSF